MRDAIIFSESMNSENNRPVILADWVKSSPRALPWAVMCQPCRPNPVTPFAYGELRSRLSILTTLPRMRTSWLNPVTSFAYGELRSRLPMLTTLPKTRTIWLSPVTSFAYGELRSRLPILNTEY